MSLPSLFSDPDIDRDYEPSIPYPYCDILSERSSHLARNIHRDLAAWPWELCPNNEPERWSSNLLETFAALAAYGAAQNSFSINDLIARLESTIRARLPDDARIRGVPLERRDVQAVLDIFVRDDMDEGSDSSDESGISEDVEIGYEQHSQSGVSTTEETRNSTPSSTASTGTLNVSMDQSLPDGGSELGDLIPQSRKRRRESSEPEATKRIHLTSRYTPKNLLGPLLPQLERLQNFVGKHISPSEVGSFHTKSSLLQNFFLMANSNLPTIKEGLSAKITNLESLEAQLRDSNSLLDRLSLTFDNTAEALDQAEEHHGRLECLAEGLENTMHKLHTIQANTEYPSEHLDLAVEDFDAKCNERWFEDEELLKSIEKMRKKLDRCGDERKKEQQNRMHLSRDIANLRAEISNTESELEMLEHLKTAVAGLDGRLESLDALCDLLFRA